LWIGEFQLNPYYIVDGYEDWVGEWFTVPYKGEWSFRLLLTDEWGDSLDGFPYNCDETMVDVPMESEFEDLLHSINNASLYHLPAHDHDGDGYSRLDSLTVYAYVANYDTTGPAYFSFRVFARDTLDNEYFLFQTPTLSQPYGQDEVWWWMHVWAGHEGLWDFRVQMLNSFGEPAFDYYYGLDPDLMDAKLELWIEDPRHTYVFDPNPVVTLNDVPGIIVDTLNDHDNMDYPAMILALIPVDLQDVEYFWGTGYLLSGPYIELDDRWPYDTDSARSYDTNFPYYRSEDAFEEVMCYYHIDHSQRYIQSLGFTNACNRIISVDAHGKADTANSTFYPFYDGTGVILFGDGGVDFAEDADDIYHEYGHAVQHNQAPDNYVYANGDAGYGNESIFMAEGFAFYMVGIARMIWGTSTATIW